MPDLQSKSQPKRSKRGITPQNISFTSQKSSFPKDDKHKNDNKRPLVSRNAPNKNSVSALSPSQNSLQTTPSPASTSTFSPSLPTQNAPSSSYPRTIAPHPAQGAAPAPQQFNHSFPAQDPYGWDDWGYGNDQLDDFGGGMGFNSLAPGSYRNLPNNSQPGSDQSPKRLTPEERVEMIEKVYKEVLCRKPDTRDINYYKYSTLGEDQIKKQLMSSAEFKEMMTKGREYTKLKEHADQLETRVRMLESQIKDQVAEFRELTNLLQEKNRHLQMMRNNCMPALPSEGGAFTYREEQNPSIKNAANAPVVPSPSLSSETIHQQPSRPTQPSLISDEPPSYLVARDDTTTTPITPQTQEIFTNEPKEKPITAPPHPSPAQETNYSDPYDQTKTDKPVKSFFKSIF